MKATHRHGTRICLVASLALTLAACVSVSPMQNPDSRNTAAADSYIARAGDTLESIAFRYRLSPHELAGLNPGIGRRIVAGTPLTIRAAANVRDAYQTQSTAQASSDAGGGRNVQREVPTFNSPMINAGHVPEQPQPPVDVPQNRTVFTPAVNAVVSDVTLLDPNQTYGRSSSMPSSVAPQQPGGVTERPSSMSLAPGWQQANVAGTPRRVDSHSLATPSDAHRGLPSGDGRLLSPTGSSALPSDVGDISRRPVSSEHTWAGRETIEEEYTGGRTLPGQQMLVDAASPSPIGDHWIWPTEGPVARGFAPIQEGRHGVDIAGLPGQAVVAVNDGVVAYSGRDPSGFGNLIIVKHKNSLLSAYSHTADLFVAENDTVSAGDPIATLGWNAQQESVLRFELRRNGASVNPMDFLSMR